MCSFISSDQVEIVGKGRSAIVDVVSMMYFFLKEG